MKYYCTVGTKFDPAFSANAGGGGGQRSAGLPKMPERSDNEQASQSPFAIFVRVGVFTLRALLPHLCLKTRVFFFLSWQV